jgi:hypothetical protein
MAELAVEILKFIFLVFLLLLVPFAVIIATPFVLLWPRKCKEDESYGRAVFRRYGRVIKTAFFISSVGGGSVD